MHVILNSRAPHATVPIVPVLTVLCAKKPAFLILPAALRTIIGAALMDIVTKVLVA